MSLYNHIYGIQLPAFYFLPMLDGKHPEEYPRFRDCFSGKMYRNKNKKDDYHIPLRETTDDDVITLFLRIGGDNRLSYVDEIKELRSHPDFIEDYDDSFDKTFACFVFNIPERWKKDYKTFIDEGPEKTSNEYKHLILNTFPKLKEKLTDLFYGKDDENS
jgi:hypothetical protein